MKKTLIILAAALAMASCAKVNPGSPVKDPEQTVDAPISFEAYNYVSSTKAAGANELRFYLGGEFKVFSFYSATEWKDLADALPENSRFIYGDIVAWREANEEITAKAWRTVDTYYWPKAGTLSFYAYYPSDVAAYAAVEKKSEGVKFTDYSVLETVEAQHASDRITTGNVVDENGKFPGTEGYTTTTGITNDLNDILVADPQFDQTANKKDTYYTKGVPMLFRHKLAKVKLQAKQAKKPEKGVVPGDFRIIINDISVDNIHLKGSYKSADATAIVWTAGDELIPATNTTTAHKNSGNFVEDMTNDGKLTDTKDSGRKDESGNPILFYKFDKTYALPYFYEDNDKTKAENKYLDLGDEYYVLPQNIDDLSNLLVDYTVFALDEDGYILSSTEYDDVKVQLNEITLTTNNIAEPIDTWKINGFYTYRLLISPYGEPILFDPAINDWDKVTADPYTIYSE